MFVHIVSCFFTVPFFLFFLLPPGLSFGFKVAGLIAVIFPSVIVHGADGKSSLLIVSHLNVLVEPVELSQLISVPERQICSLPDTSCMVVDFLVQRRFGRVGRKRHI